MKHGHRSLEEITKIVKQNDKEKKQRKIQPLDPSPDDEFEVIKDINKKINEIIDYINRSGKNTI